MICRLMKIRDYIFLIAGGALSAFALVALYILSSTSTPAPMNPPTVAGQKVPMERISLNMTNHFTFYCGSSREFHDCKIVGFTGEENNREPAAFSSGYVSFDRWLVLEDGRGRRFFVRPGDIQYIEDLTNFKTF